MGKVKIKGQHRQFRPLVLWLIVAGTEMTRQVSTPNPCYRGRRSCGFLSLSASEEDVIDIGEEEGELSETSKGTGRHDRVA
jgi:hypothetical protein